MSLSPHRETYWSMIVMLFISPLFLLFPFLLSFLSLPDPSPPLRNRTPSWVFRLPGPYGALPLDLTGEFRSPNPLEMKITDAAIAHINWQPVTEKGDFIIRLSSYNLGRQNLGWQKLLTRGSLDARMFSRTIGLRRAVQTAVWTTL